MDLRRAIRHLSTGQLAVGAAFPAHTLRAIEQAIRAAEASHSGQIRFAVEASLDFAALRHNQTASERAIEIFAQLRVWDTEHNNGVLIYLLLADRDVEIVADRGIHAKLGQPVWEAICRDMEAAFRLDDFEGGVIAGVRAVGDHLRQHFPTPSDAPNGHGKDAAPDYETCHARFPHPCVVVAASAALQPRPTPCGCNPPPMGVPKVGNPLSGKPDVELTQGTSESPRELHVNELPDQPVILR